jgi:hypothetical protein
MFQKKELQKKPKHTFSIQTFPENRAVCEKMWENIIDGGRP